MTIRSFSVGQNDEMCYQPDQWRRTPGLTRPELPFLVAEQTLMGVRNALLFFIDEHCSGATTCQLGTPSPPPITDGCSRPSHIESSCGLPLATLCFFGLLILFHAVVPASITRAFTAGTPPLGLHRALATPPCGAWAQFVVAGMWQ